MTLRHLITAVAVISASSTASAQLSLSDATFFIDEAWRADTTVTQHALSIDEDDWNYELTAEWASTGRDQKIGFTIPVTLGRSWDDVLGDVSLDASWQIRGHDHDRFALSPSLSISMPGSAALDGDLTPGLSVVVPLTLRHGARMATHWSVRMGWTDLSAAGEPNETAFGIAAVGSYGERFLAVLESELVLHRQGVGPGRESWRELTISPGCRWEVRSLLPFGIVPGIAIPVTISDDATTVGLMFHAMLERPFGTSPD